MSTRPTLCRAIASFACLAIASLSPAIAAAQNSVAAKETSIPGGVLVIATYVILWIMIFGFVASVLRKQSKVASDLDALEARLDSVFADEIDAPQEEGRA